MHVIILSNILNYFHSLFSCKLITLGPLSWIIFIHLFSFLSFIDFIVVQSTDKNFMVPVGGAIVCSPNPTIISEVAKLYPGRANMSPILDLFVTLLSMGEDGLVGLWRERQRVLIILKEKLNSFATLHGERILLSPRNSISIGVTLETLCTQNNPESKNIDPESGQKNEKKDQNPELGPSISAGAVTFLGSMLFQRNVSGCRVVPKSSSITTINGIDFIGWGSHTSNYSDSYFTAACSIGIKVDEIELFFDRLEKAWKKYEKSMPLKNDTKNGIKNDIGTVQKSVQIDNGQIEKAFSLDKIVSDDFLDDQIK